MLATIELNILSSRLRPKKFKIKMYKTIILPVALHWYETWSLTLGEEHRLRMFENRVLRRKFGFGPKRDEIMKIWRKLHNEELHNSCFSLNVIRVIKSRRIRWKGM
jgi:hypothetical protein